MFIHERQCRSKRNNEARSRNDCCCGQAKLVHILRVCVYVCGVCVCVCVGVGVGVCVAVFIEHAKRMRHMILSSVAYLFVPNFVTLCRK